MAIGPNPHNIKKNLNINDDKRNNENNKDKKRILIRLFKYRK